MSDTSSLETTTESVYDYADLILDYLHQIGVEYVFGVPGGAIEPLFNALARSERRGKIKTVIARHECGAAFMADGYYRETGKLGVVCSTTGPGATNLITGVASAAVDNSSILVITAQTALPKFGKKPLQDSSETAIDTVGIFRHCTKFSSLVSHSEQLESKLVSALMQAWQSPRGPVHLSIPSDILRTPYDLHRPTVHVKSLMKQGSIEDRYAIDALATEIKSSNKIVLFLGHGCGQAYAEIEKFAEAISAPFVSGPMGKSWVNDKHPLYRGVHGYAGHQSAYDLFDNSDIELILAVGTSVTEMGFGSLLDNFPNDRIIHIDSTVENFSRTPLAKLHVCGHLDLVFNRLLNMINAQSWRRTWDGIKFDSSKNIVGGYADLIDTEKCNANTTPIKPQQLMAELSSSLPFNARVFIDTGNIWAWATHYFVKESNQGVYRVSMGYGSMAWAIGAVIGSAFGQPEEPHVCFCGDGAWLMSSHEIGVAVQHKLPILFIVLNDSAYGMIRCGQELSKAESIGWKLNEVDFAMLAKAQGAAGHIIDSPEQLRDINLDAIFSNDVPTLLDIRIDPNEVPPMMARIKSLNEGDSSVDGYK